VVNGSIKQTNSDSEEADAFPKDNPAVKRNHLGKIMLLLKSPPNTNLYLVEILIITIY